MAGELKQFSWEELKALDGKDNCHMLIHGKVYAISAFLDEHPGGDEVLLGECGRDATEAFEDVGHSDEARDMLKQYLVGTGPAGTAPKGGAKKAGATASANSSTGSFNYLLPLAGIVAFIAYKVYSDKFAA